MRWCLTWDSLSPFMKFIGGSLHSVMDLTFDKKFSSFAMVPIFYIGFSLYLLFNKLRNLSALSFVNIFKSWYLHTAKNRQLMF